MAYQFSVDVLESEMASLFSVDERKGLVKIRCLLKLSVEASFYDAIRVYKSYFPIETSMEEIEKAICMHACKELKQTYG